MPIQVMVGWKGKLHREGGTGEVSHAWTSGWNWRREGRGGKNPTSVEEGAQEEVLGLIGDQFFIILVYRGA